MNSPPLHPPRALKWASALSQVLIWAVTAVWLLFALTWSAIHWVIVPRIDDWRPQMERLATQALGVPVRLGTVRATSNGLIPALELNQVRFLDPQGRDALVLQRVLTSLSVTSVWRLGFEQVLIEQPELDVRRSADGRWQVAGLDLMSGAHQPGDNTAAADWLFSQNELALRGGRVHWTDELHGQTTVTLEDVDVVLRNDGRQHLARIDATPRGMGQRLNFQADFRSPLLSLHPGRWTEWTGTAYGALPHMNLARMAVAGSVAKVLGVRITDGHGALRVWLDVVRGQPTAITTDLALTQLHARWPEAAHALELRDFAGRLNLQRHSDGWEMSTQGLNFRTPNGQDWKDGELRWRQRQGREATRLLGEFDARRIHLGAVRELATGLPLPGHVQRQLHELQPDGQLDTLQLRWTQGADGWDAFTAKGQASSLSLRAEAPAEDMPDSAASTRPGRPGFQGASADFEFNQDGGQARLRVDQGHLVFPGVFDEPTVPMDTLTADVRWRVDAEHIQVQLPAVRFANADVEGQASAQWRTSDPATSPSGGRFPGVLKLDGTLTRGKGDRVYRYLPRVIASDARQYVRESVLGGQASEVRFHVDGDVYQMPFENPRDGAFRISAQIHNAEFAYIPPSFAPAGAPRWPAFRQLEGELVFDRIGMQLKVRKALVSDAPGLRVVQGQARIARLDQTAVVEVQARLDGPLVEALGVVRRSPLADMTGNALKKATGNGQVQVQFGLSVPLMHTSQTSVKGQVVLNGNDLQIHPDTPLLGKVRGAVEFSQQGFQVAQAQARLLGGEVQFSGGLRTQDGPDSLQFRGQGVATAEGLRQARFLGPVSRLAERASGSTPYTAQIGWRRGMAQVDVQSGLQGLQLQLPAPLTKTAEAIWPLTFRQKLLDGPTPSPPTEALSLDVAAGGQPRLSALLHRQWNDDVPTLTRGVLRVGAAAGADTPLPARGLTAEIDWPEVDVDAWEQALEATSTSGNPAPAAGTTPDWPDRVKLRTAKLTLARRAWHGIAAEGTRQGQTWQMQVLGRELAGRLEYRPALPASGQKTGQLLARLDRLSLTGAQEPPGPAAPENTAQGTLPSLDAVVQALELDGRPLGRLELQATSRAGAAAANEWELHRLQLKVPEAELSATGNWAPGPDGATTSASPPASARRTELQFRLDVQDSGALLQRFGMPGVFRGGKGLLQGQIGWTGAPTGLDKKTLAGQIKVDLAHGQFLKADPGLAKLLGVLSLQSLPRRLTLDFSDVFAQGFVFDFIRGNARIEHGVAFTNNLQMKGVNAAVLMEGTADIARETQDIRALVVPEINAGTASLLATVINPAIGLGSFLAQAILRQPLIQASTQEFRIRGTWTEPQVEKMEASPENGSP